MKDKTEEVNASNEKIARFMGLYKCPDGAWSRNKSYTGDFILAYNNRWDELMPVVEKIQTLPEFYTVNIGYFGIQNLGMYSHVAFCNITDSRQMPRGECNGTATLIESVYNAVCEFLDWHSQQTGKTE